MKHTPGLLKIAGRETRGLPHTLVAADTLLFRVYSKAYGDIEEEKGNARRLVACWNACDGVSTDALENITIVGGTLASRFEALIDSECRISAQREELLQALKQMLDAFCHDPLGGGQDAAVEAALDAIAKAEGEK